MEKEFQHISVVPADDEIVIQAGVRRAPEAQEAEEEAESVEDVEGVPEVEDDEVEAAEEPLEYSAAAAEDAFVAFFGGEVSPEVAAEADAKAEAQLENMQSGAHNLNWAIRAAVAEERAENPRGKEEYSETTLEDLKSAPMSKLQKIILAVLGVLLVVFIVYYVTNFG